MTAPDTGAAQRARFTACVPACIAFIVALFAAALLGACGGSKGAPISTTGAVSSTTGAASSATASRPSATSTTSPTARSTPQRAVPDGDWPTFDFTAARTGVGPSATGIAAGTVRHLVARIVHVDGTVDSAPIQLHGVTVDGRRRDAVFVTTTYGRTIALDPGTGQRLWEYTPADIARYQGTAQVTTTTPVADPDRRYIYAASPDGVIHKLAVTTGAEVRAGGWPVRVTYNPVREKLAGALNLDGASVVVVTGGYYGDAPVYQGHVVLIDRATGRIGHVFNALCSNARQILEPTSRCASSDAAIWARAGSVVEPRTHRILVATGNASFNGRTNWGDSVLELAPSLQLLHNWTPVDQARLHATDDDLGSTAPALVTVGGRHLAIQGGKDRMLDVLDLDRLDGTTRPAGPPEGGELQAIASPGSAEVLTAPVVWAHRGRRYVFVADDGGTAAYIAHGGQHPGLNRLWSTSIPGTSPVLAGGMLYVYDEIGGALDVYAPTSGARLAALSAAVGHWNSPIVVGGRVILPVGSYHTRSLSGEIEIWQAP